MRVGVECDGLIRVIGKGCRVCCCGGMDRGMLRACGCGAMQGMYWE